MAGGGKVFVFAAIGLFGGIAGVAQIHFHLFALDNLLLQVFVTQLQLTGALGDALFQFLIEAF